METPSALLSSVLFFFPISLLFLSPCFFGWMRYHNHSCVNLVNGMHLNFVSLSTLALAAACCVFYATRHWIYCRFETVDIFFDFTLIWYQKHKQQTHTWHLSTNILTHTDIYWPALPWMNKFMIEKITLEKSAKGLLFKNYSLSEVIHCMIRFSKIKSFVWSTKNTNRNGINGQNTHSTQTEKDNFKRVSYC